MISYSVQDTKLPFLGPLLPLPDEVMDSGETEVVWHSLQARNNDPCHTTLFNRRQPCHVHQQSTCITGAPCRCRLARGLGRQLGPGWAHQAPAPG